MKNYTLTAELSPRSLNDLSKKVGKLSLDMEKVKERFIAFSLEWVENKAKQYLTETIGKTSYRVTGEMQSSFVKSIESSNWGILRNIHPNSAAVEYGTGLPGKWDSHEQASAVGWAYNLNGKVNGWVYVDESGKFHRTYGIRPHRFMYRAITEYNSYGKGVCIKRALDSVLKLGGAE